MNLSLNKRTRGSSDLKGEVREAHRSVSMQIKLTYKWNKNLLIEASKSDWPNVNYIKVNNYFYCIKLFSNLVKLTPGNSFTVFLQI